MDRDTTALFVEHGYTVLRQAVPRGLVDRALRAINHSLGHEGMNRDDLPVLRARSYCPELRDSDILKDLFMATPVWAALESLIGQDELEPVANVQIPLRFPTLDTSPPDRLHPHLDGMATKDNGVDPGFTKTFTALAVILLSDLPEPWMGNFTLYPGTHRLYEAHFREHGSESLLQGMPDIDMPQPVQITGRAGDVCLMHYQIAHTAAWNLSPHVRYAAIARITKKGHAERRPKTMTDIWMEWDGLR